MTFSKQIDSRGRVEGEIGVFAENIERIFLRTESEKVGEEHGLIRGLN